jgi:hypothetical protein
MVRAHLRLTSAAPSRTHPLPPGSTLTVSEAWGGDKGDPLRAQVIAIAQAEGISLRGAIRRLISLGLSRYTEIMEDKTAHAKGD